MTQPDHSFPLQLQRLNELDFDYADGEGIDFEPYRDFLSPEETTDWFRAWTGNNEADGTCFRIFGQDGTGGYAAFWITDPERALLDQPVVFLGSEGETGVIAEDFSSYLWLLAAGIGPFEAVAYSGSKGSPQEHFEAFAQEVSGQAKLEGAEVLKKAKARYTDFSSWVESLCR